MATPRTVAFHTLGCKLNYAESASIAQQFLKSGYQEVSFEEPSDLYIINTCSVTDQADKKCRKAVRQAKNRNQDAEVIVIGCYAQLKPKEISEIPGVSLVLGASEKFNILNQIQQRVQHMPAQVYSQPIKELNEFIPSYSIEDRTRSFLKVQDGCDYKCSFCTIPQARGRSRSGSVASLVETAHSLVERGIQEIVLTGVNIGDFGKNLQGEGHGSFLELIQALDELPSPLRIRISSIEPNLCSDEIIDFVLSSKHFVPHFHMPLQSGDDTILAKMQRRYRKNLYKNRVEHIKKLDPSACIGVDVIAGFPGETDEHFNNTFHFIEDLEISYLHVFTYSERKNTLAAQMESTIPAGVRKQRSDQLRVLSDQKKIHFYRQQLGQVKTVLVEHASQGEQLLGWTENYIRVGVPKESSIPNAFLPVRLKDIRLDMVCEVDVL